METEISEIEKLVAIMYQGKNWHRLNESEHSLVKLLEDRGLIIPNKPANGFVGRVAFAT